MKAWGCKVSTAITRVNKAGCAFEHPVGCFVSDLFEHLRSSKDRARPTTFVVLVARIRLGGLGVSGLGWLRLLVEFKKVNLACNGNTSSELLLTLPTKYLQLRAFLVE